MVAKKRYYTLDTHKLVITLADAIKWRNSRTICRAPSTVKYMRSSTQMEMNDKKLPKHRRKSAREITPRNYSTDENAIMKRVFEWVSEAVERERRGELVFMESRDKALLAGKICGVSRTKIIRVQKEIDEENKKEKGRPTIQLDEFDQRGLSRLILGFYKRNPPVLPTMEKIHAETKEIPGFPSISRGTLFKWIKKLGFVVKKRNSKMMVYQRMDVVAHRHRYLRSIEEYRGQGYAVYYQDETWCCSNHTRQYIWQCEDGEKNEFLSHTTWNGGLNVPCGSGGRIIVNDIGSKDGFLDGCREVFIGKKNTGDYHNEMNGDHFEAWWKEKVLPSLPPRSVIVIDNAKYHSRITPESKTPTTAWRKAEIQRWLLERNVTYDEKNTKPILLQKVKNMNVVKKMMLEKLTSDYCEMSQKDIVILRLPVGHSELNPIELIWAQSKNEVARNNNKFNVTSVQRLMQNALLNVTKINWENAIEHVKKVEAAFKKVDFGDAETPIVDDMIIELDGNSSSDESEDDFLDELL